MGEAKLPARDFDFVEARLLAPASDAMDAIERLQDCGATAQATRLLDALARFTDECREIRRTLRRV